MPDVPDSIREVLIVEDDETTLSMVADTLSIYKNQLNILTAADGIEAVKIIKSSPVVDLVLTDFVMPKMNGFELIAYLNKNHPEIPVILMTVWGKPKIRKIFYNMGIFRFLEKPFNLPMMVDTVFAALVTRPEKAYVEKRERIKISNDRKKEILKPMKSADDLLMSLYHLAHLFKSHGRYGEAILCLRELLELSTDVRANATYLLTLGQIMENMNEFEDSLSYYQEAAALCNTTDDISYSINNNMGFSLCMLKRFYEAEKYCGLAIKIDPNRLNAFKNLGISLEGQGRLRESINAYVTAIKINAKDKRPLTLFKRLLDKHPELKDEYNNSFKKCRRIVKNAYQYSEKSQWV
jgi:CheY-like chemotaxis protein